ncbi:MAG: 4Fe-4S dicluster domain-containing protein, partial [Myxococcota bacterium]
DGTAAIGQPLIDPLHNARSCDQLLWQIADGTVTKAQDLVRQTWLGLGKPLATEKQWRKAVHDGTIPGTAFPPASGKTRDPATSRDAIHRVSTKKTRVALHGEILPHFVRQDDKANKAAQRLAPNNLEVVFMPSYAVGDGRLANLAWLQELPDSMTKLTWGNALLLSPTLAKDMGIRSQTRGRLYQADVVRLRLGNSPAVETPTFVLPGLPPYSVVATLGYGRTHAGVVGNGVGVNFHPLLPNDGSLWALGGRITLTGKTKPLACTQEQFAMNAQAVRAGTTLGLAERDPTRNATAEHYRQHPDYVKAKGLPMLLTHKEGGTNSSNTTHAGATKESFAPLQTHKPWRYTGNKWGMVIDLTACIGCGACVTACQAENNIPVVGPAQVMRGRILHWIRVDRYYTGPVENPRAIHQPVVCMHCENAPCEPVCPVAATTHDSEGLNVMTYNRCIGTRYCANNCPYKVRRFNYLDYSNSGDMYVAPEKKRRQRLTALQHNPDVTVRYRGVMEKCTYCTQRIQQAKHKARLEKRDPHALRDGDVTPACAQTCPTQAITFGNLNDPNSAVATLKKADRDYQLLAELNTRPRTSYLGRLHNPLRGLATKPSADKKTS